MRKRSFTIPIDPFVVNVTFDCHPTIKSFEESCGFAEDSDRSILALTFTDARGVRVIMGPESSPSTLCHECIHAAHRVLDLSSDGAHDEEIEARIADYLFSKSDERIFGKRSVALDLSDPAIVHSNMLRGTIAWTPERLRHLLGGDAA